MVGADDDHQLIARDGLADENRIVDLAFDKAKIRFPAAHRGRGLARIADREPDRDPRMRAPERDEIARQPIAGDGLTGVNGEDAALQMPSSERTRPAARLGQAPPAPR